VNPLLQAVDDVVGRVPAELVGPDEQDVTTDPQHGGVPITDSHRSSFGMARTSIRPARCAAVSELRVASASPTSSIFTMAATTP
jgi:hypothetical protein